MVPKIEIGMMIFMGAALIAVFVNRWQLKRGIVGLRVTQFMAVMVIPPLAVVLALENKLGTDAVATILGTVIGYVLSPLSKEGEDSNESDRK